MKEGIHDGVCNRNRAKDIQKNRNWILEMVFGMATGPGE
jgi:hypothetical protein